MKTSQSTWFPFQSAEAREICAHLTPAEQARLMAQAHQNGSEIGLWIATPGSMAGVSFVASWQLGVAALALYAIYIVVSGWPRLRAMRRRSRELLCETEWARGRGYTPERLRWWKLPGADERPPA